MSAGWWLSVNDTVVHAKGEMITWKSQSNNVAEYFGLIRALESALDRGFTRLAMNMDSLLVVQHVLGLWKCKNPVLIELLQYVRALADQFDSFTISHTLREGNTVADALCNKAFEGFKGSGREWYNTVDKLVAGHEVKAKVVIGAGINSSKWMEWKSIVLEELKSFGPMIRNDLIPEPPTFEIFQKTESDIASAKVLPLVSSLDERIAWPYVIEHSALNEMQKLAKEGNIPWDSDRYKTLVPTVNQYGVNVFPYPKCDAQFTTDILRGIGWNLPRLIRAWRGQTADDSRPNKSLDFQRIEKSTAGYEHQSALKTIINDGYGLHWKEPFVGVRPIPKNLSSAEDNAEIMGAMILKQYKKGRLMVFNADEVAVNVPEFASSAYGCVPKANKPLTHACRPIHNQSGPIGCSVNEGLDASLRPDAIWPGAGHIADRILAAARLYGASTLKGFVTDITDAFLQVGLNDHDAQVNGGVLPQSGIATLATSCVFGNCESPAAFRILNCVPHIHGQSSSVINGINTAFDVRFYVDDGNAIEPDLENRLFLAETSLRDSIFDVFGADSIQEEKTTSWATNFTSLGYSWDLPSGTVSIPAEKLLRVKNELLRFSTLTHATITEFRSLVGKLRHVSTCCKPAGALMQMLGGGLSCHKVAGGRQKRKITSSMRTELLWWSSFLTPARFHNLPVEWLGKRENKVCNWIHCYSETNVGVWLVCQSEGTMRYTPWNTSRLVTLLQGIHDSLVAHRPADRMNHTRIIINECGLAKVLNQGSSPDTQVQNLLKSIGKWQLDHRHRISATTPLWENSPPLLLSPCTYHSNTNPLFQISAPPSMAKRLPPLLVVGKHRPSPKAPRQRISDRASTGYSSAPLLTSRPSGSMSSARVTKPPSWPGSQSSVEPRATTRRGKEISTPRTLTKRLPSSGLTSFIETQSCSSMVLPCSWWKLPIKSTKTVRNPRSQSLPVCCSDVAKSYATPTLRGGRSHGGSSSYNISSSVVGESFGKRIMPEMALIKRNVTTESSGTTSCSRIETATPSIIQNQKKSTRFRSPLIMPKQIKLGEETSLPLEHPVTLSSALSVEPSWHSRAEARGNQKGLLTRYQAASNPPTSLEFSREPPRPKEWTRMMLPDIPLGLDTQLHSSKPDTTSSLYGWQDGGQAKPWLATLASRVRSY